MHRPTDRVEYTTAFKCEDFFQQILFPLLVLKVVYVLMFFSIRKAVALINDLESSKFPLLLSRITQKLHLKVLLVVMVFLIGWDIYIFPAN